ncbi:MAG: LPS export ABC transporter periplasmic protein LptC [Pseudomonadota bacterium]
MARADNRYSRFVARAKVLLPLAALAILASLFLLARTPERGALPFVERDLREIVRERSINAPTYTGRTEAGGDISATAEVALPRQDDSDLVDVRVFEGRLVEADGGAMTVSAESGTLNTGDQIIDLAGSVVVITDDGYRLTTDVLGARLDGTLAEAPGPVEVTGPNLRITGGEMQLTTRGEGSGSRVVFKGGVRLLYTPRSQ